MLKVVLIEDNAEAAETLLEYLQRYASKNGISLSSARFRNAFDFLEAYAYDADVLFFDIEMPGMNGMEAAKKVREKDTKAMIVFTTNLAQYAIEGYSVNAFDYI